MAAEDVRQRELIRVPILVRKLIEDLEMAEKIFVVKRNFAITEEEIFPLVAAIRRYGPNTLLFATFADQAHPAATVERRAPGLMIGYISRFAPEENAHDLLLDQWLRICREAYRLRLDTNRTYRAA
jgi:hypothetical protein